MKLTRHLVRLFPERLDLVLDLVRDLAPSLFPLWLALPPRAGEGEMRCLAATLAATDEGPGFPFSMADERKGSRS